MNERARGQKRLFDNRDCFDRLFDCNCSINFSTDGVHFLREPRLTAMRLVVPVLRNWDSGEYLRGKSSALSNRWRK